MEPGRELDRLIAEKVFGCKPYLKTFETTEGDHKEYYCDCVQVKHLRYDDEFGMIHDYSTDIAAAWEVVEKLDLLFSQGLGREGDGWRVFVEDYIGGGYDTVSKCESAPHAICLAALAHVKAFGRRTSESTAETSFQKDPSSSRE